MLAILAYLYFSVVILFPFFVVLYYIWYWCTSRVPFLWHQRDLLVTPDLRICYLFVTPPVKVTPHFLNRVYFGEFVVSLYLKRCHRNSLLWGPKRVTPDTWCHTTLIGLGVLWGSHKSDITEMVSHNPDWVRCTLRVQKEWHQTRGVTQPWLG